MVARSVGAEGKAQHDEPLSHALVGKILASTKCSMCIIYTANHDISFR